MITSKKAISCFSSVLVLVIFFSCTIYIVTGSTYTYDQYARITGAGAFNEDFFTTTYRSSSTTASGWGTGGVTSERVYDYELTDYISTDYYVKNIEIQGHKAFISVSNDVDGTDSLRILDLRDIWNIKELASRDAGYAPHGVGVNGDLFVAGVGSTYHTLTAYNISSPNDFGNEAVDIIFDSIATDGAISDIEIDGSFIYAAVWGSVSDKGLLIINASNPEQLQVIPNNWTSDDTVGLALRGQHLYIIESTGYLTILNATDKSNLLPLGTINLSYLALDCIVEGNYAYVCGSFQGVFIVDIHNPTNPTIVGHYDTDANSQKIAKQGNTLIIAEHNHVIVLDVANPSEPILVTELPVQQVWDVAIYGQVVLVGSENGFYCYKLSGGMVDLTTPTFYTHYDDYQVWDVRVDGDVAFIAGGEDGFYTLDISNHMYPVLLDRYSLSGGNSFKKLDIYGTFAYLVDDNAIGTFDVSDPTNIQFINYIYGAYITDVFVEGGILYLSYRDGIAIVNVTDIYDMNVIYYDNLGLVNATSLFVQGQLLHLVDNVQGNGNGYYIYDITDLSNPVETDKYYFSPASGYDVCVDGDMAYIAHMQNLYQFNVSNPYVQSLWGAQSYNSYGIAKFGPYLVTADSTDGFSLVNITDPSSWHIPSRNTIATGAIQVAIAGDFAYIANTTSLVIQRIHNSAADSFADGIANANSIEFDTTDYTITNATLTVNEYTEGTCRFDYFLSVDGIHLEPVTPGVLHTFAYTGNELRFHVTVRQSLAHRPYLYSLSISYGFNDTVIPTPTPTTTTSETASIHIFILSGLLITSFITIYYQRKRR